MSQPERRNHYRYKLWVPARIQAGGAAKLAIGHDMSQTGALLVSRSKVEPGTAVSLYVRVPPDSEQEFHLTAQVVRSERNDADPNGLWPYRIAVRFDENSPELEALLRTGSKLLEGLSADSEQIP